VHQPPGLEVAPRVVYIGGTSVHDTTFGATVDWVLDRAARRAGGYICTPNVDYVIQARRNPAFRQAVEGASLRVPDGMWIVYASRIAGDPVSETVTGRLLLPAIAQRCADAGLTIAPVWRRAGSSVCGSRAPRTRLPGSDGGSGDHAASGTEDRIAGRRRGRGEARCCAAFRCLRLFGRPETGDLDALPLRSPGWLGSARRWSRAGHPGRPFSRSATMDDPLRPGMAFRLAQEPRRLARRYLVDDPWILAWAARARLARTFRRSSGPGTP